MVGCRLESGEPKLNDGSLGVQGSVGPTYLLLYFENI
jgi:hypothetical protein